MRLSEWTVDYGDGPKPCKVPHAWRQDVDVRWEGPAVYRKRVRIPDDAVCLRFHGISYAAEVAFDGEIVCRHQGIWDAFEVPLEAYRGQTIEVAVSVVKNGGPTYPVRDVASGFLPFVYHTFGGIYKEVELIDGSEPKPKVVSKPVVEVDGSRVWIDSRPFYARGALTWGWYPELGHVNPDLETIRREIKIAKEYGFNLIKFCLWVPPHAYLEELARQGMYGWIELPLWDPTPDPALQAQMAAELERIVEQYKHHPNVPFWTVGCELSTTTPPEYRQRLVQMVKDGVGVHGLVKDNSGGAEMYGGDPQEYGEFYDFHPYCDTPFYPVVLDSLQPGPRTPMPILLGEFNDIDVHRDTARMIAENPYWVSPDPALNDQGVRWQLDFPTVLPGNRFTRPENEAAHHKLMEGSKRKAEFIRKTVQEAVRSHSDIAGYVITGWIDTPISTAGFVDEHGEPRYPAMEVRRWNGPDSLFVIPNRRPPWVNGGNRPGWVDPLNHACGPVHLKIGAHSERGLHGVLEWDIIRFSWEGGRKGRIAIGESLPIDVTPLTSTQIGEVYWRAEEPGGYLLRVNFAGQTNAWPLWVTAPWTKEELAEWEIYDPASLLDPVAPLASGTGVKGLIATRIPHDLAERLARGQNVLLFLVDEGTKPMPFWREAAYEFESSFWSPLGFNEAWERLLAVSPDRSVDPAFLAAFGEARVLLNRIDTRTYAESPMLAQVGSLITTTLRPFGGLGIQPAGLPRNPAGQELLRGLLRLF